MKKKTILILLIVLLMVISGGFYGLFLQDKDDRDNDNDNEKKAVLISDKEDIAVDINTINSKDFIEMDEYNADYYLVELADVNTRMSDILKYIVETDKKVIIISDNVEESKAFIDGLFKINASIATKVSELVGVCIYKWNDETQIIPLTHATFSEGKNGGAGESFIKSDNARVEWVCKYSLNSVETLLEDIKKHERRE